LPHIYEATKEAIYLKRIGIDLGILDGDYVVMLHEDSQACIKIADNPCLAERTKHFDIKYHWLREQIKKMNAKLSYINTHDQLADIFTKPLGFIQRNLLKNRMTGYGVWLFVRVGVLELAASPCTGNGAPPLIDFQSTTLSVTNDFHSKEVVQITKVFHYEVRFDFVYSHFYSLLDVSVK
jgi:hypothetical protein